MLSYIVRRILYMFPLLIVISFIAFITVVVRPGDAFTTCDFGAAFSGANCKTLRARYGFQGPWYEQYARWIKGVLLSWEVDAQFPFVHWRPDFGMSAQTGQPSLEYLFSGGKLANTLVLILLTSLFAWIIALPMGIYSATHKYSIGDHSFTFLGFLGLSIPNFFLALLVLYILVMVFQVGPKYGLSTTGLCSTYPLGAPNAVDYCSIPWWPPSWGKLLNYLWHAWPAVLIIGSANIAALLRYTRGNLLDVLGEDYVQTARAKGLSERIVVYKHAFRNAVNPLISIFGFWVPTLFEGTLVAAIVLNLPITENVFWLALQTQDQYIVLTGLIFFSVALLIGNLLADILLAWADPKIRYD